MPAWEYLVEITVLADTEIEAVDIVDRVLNHPEIQDVIYYDPKRHDTRTCPNCTREVAIDKNDPAYCDKCGFVEDDA